MQFTYRFGAVVIGLATFAFAWLMLGVLWTAHLPQSATPIYAIAYSWPMAIPALLIAWIPVRVWRWVCGQSPKRKTMEV